MKNIILLITDTFRYDNLFDNAKRPVKTPELDAFASNRATNLTRFYTGSFPTIPNRTDIATGRLGWPHYGWQPIDLSSRNHIATTLRRQGYTTQLLCDCPHLFNSRFQFGFDAAYQHRGQEGDKHLLHSNTPIENILPLEKTRQHPLWKGASLADAHRWINRYSELEDETFAAKTASTAVRWLEENFEADPFFIWVDFFDPHEPWDPPEYFVKNYDPDYEGTPMIHCNYGPATDYSPEELRNLWAHYAAESEIVDRHLGRVLQKIEDLQLWDDSIVIITSDHGTSLGEHNRTGKSNIANNDERYWPIYPEVGHVPFLIAGSDVPCGRELDFLAQPYDILPTLSDLCGFELQVPEPVNGASFASLLSNGATEHREIAVSSGHIVIQKDGGVPDFATTPFVVTKEWGYAPIGAEGVPEFYNLVDDPWAENNVIDQCASELVEIRAKFSDLLEKHETPKIYVDALSG